MLVHILAERLQTCSDEHRRRENNRIIGAHIVTVYVGSFTDEENP